MPVTLITAHAGAENTPDNGLQSVHIQLSCGAEVMEVDVFHHEGQLLLTHDAPRPGDHPPLLREALALLRQHPGKLANLDLKSPDILQESYLLAREMELEDRILFTGDVLTPRDFAQARSLNAQVWYNHTHIPSGDLLDGAAAAGHAILNMNWQLCTEEMLLRAPRRLSLWTVNDEDALRRFLRAGVRNITTRVPGLALRVRREIQGE